VYTFVVNHQLAGAEALRLCQDLSRIPVAGSPPSLQLCLRRVRELDANGCAALVRVFSRLAVSGGTLVLTDVTEPVHNTLAEVGLDAVLDVYPLGSQATTEMALEVSGPHSFSNIGPLR